MQTNTRTHNMDEKEGNVMNNPNRGSSRKEQKMNAIIKTLLAAVLVALGLPLSIWAAEPPKPKSPPDGALPPYGSADFQASRERPVGWRGNIQGTFIGATPPLAGRTSANAVARSPRWGWRWKPVRARRWNSCWPAA